MAVYPAMIPTEIKLAEGRRVLTVTWPNGATSRISASSLRHHSRAAAAVRAEIDGLASPPDDVTLTGVEPIGSYAVRLSFSDGHDRGIYPWSHLRAVADDAA